MSGNTSGMGEKLPAKAPNTGELAKVNIPSESSQSADAKAKMLARLSSGYSFARRAEKAAESTTAALPVATNAPGSSWLDDLDKPEPKAEKPSGPAKTPRQIPTGYTTDHSHDLVILPETLARNLRKPPQERFESTVKSLAAATTGEFDEAGEFKTVNTSVDLSTKIQVVLSNYDLKSFVTKPSDVVDVKVEKGQITVEFKADGAKNRKLRIDSEGIIRA